MNFIFNVALQAGKDRLEKSLAELLGGEALRFFPGKNHAHLLCIRAKYSNRQIVPDPMRAQKPEGIGVRACQKEIELVDRKAGYFKGAHARNINVKASGKDVVRGFPGGCKNPAVIYRSREGPRAARFRRTNKPWPPSGAD